MLVKIGRIREQPAAPDESLVTSQLFVLYTTRGRIESAFSIDQLKLAHPPPEADKYATVTYNVPSEEDEALTRTKPWALRKHYKLYLLDLHHQQHALEQLKRQATARASFSAAAATQVADNINATLTATSLQPPRPPTPPPPPPALPDDLVYPCSHCKMILPAADLSHCFYGACRAPFHTPGTGCRKARVEVVNGVLLYCKRACAQKDGAVGAQKRALRMR